MRSPTVTKKKQKRKRYTDEFKAEVLRAVETRGQRTIGDVAASLGVSEGLIHTWKGLLARALSAQLRDRGRRPRLGRRYHLPLDRRGLVLLGGPARLVLAPRGRLGARS